MNLYNEFKKIALQYPKHICLTDKHIQLTYENCLHKIDEYSNLIKHIPNHTLGVIYMPKSVNTVLWQLCLNKNNIAFATMEWQEHSRYENIVSTMKPSIIISGTENQLNIIEESNFNFYYDCAYIVQSSGSTGQPKKILLQDLPIIEVVQEQANITKMNEHGKMLWLLNPAFDASLSDIYMTILSGGELVITEHKANKINTIIELIKQHQITHIDLPPSIFHIFYNYYLKNKFTLHSLKHIIFGGEKANENIVFKLLPYFSLYNAYGPSETTICSSLKVVTNNWNNQNIGTPLKGVHYKIVEQELHIGGTHCALGYDQEKLNNKFYIKNNIKWFKSGDIVIEKNNEFFYIGRKDRQIKHNGQLICPEEIEHVAYKNGAIFAKIEYFNQKITLRYEGNLNINNFKQQLPTWCIPHIYENTTMTINNNGKTI